MWASFWRHFWTLSTKSATAECRNCTHRKAVETYATTPHFVGRCENLKENNLRDWIAEVDEFVKRFAGKVSHRKVPKGTVVDIHF